MSPDRPGGGARARLTTWLGRAIALACVASLVPSLVTAWNQLGNLHPLWLAMVAGPIVAISFMMPLYAWANLPLKTLSAGYAGLVLVGIATFPLAWTSSRPLTGTPWLWACVGVAAVFTGLSTSVRWGIGYAVLAGAGFGVLRLTSAGGAVSWDVAAQDALGLIVLPAAALLVLGSFLGAVDALAAQTRQGERVEADALMERALADQRRMLDGIIHDDVMTTLVAAAHANRPPQELRALAAEALAALDQAALPSEAEQPVTASQFARLLQDMVEQVAPDAVVRLHPAQRRGWQLSPLAASLLGQATREAALNAQKHAEADHISVDIRPSVEPARIELVVEITDDGVGFEPAQVPTARLGLRVSINERMGLIGGRADVESAPGRGSLVRLVWGEETGPAAAEAGAPETWRAAHRHVRVANYLVAIWLLVGAQVAVGMTTLLHGVPAAGLVGAVIAMVAATLVATAHARADDRLGSGEAAAVVGLLTGASWLVDSGLPAGGPGHPLWHATVVPVLLIVLMVRGQGRWALAGLALFVAEATRRVLVGGLGAGELLLAVFRPIVWVGLCAVLLQALARIGREIAEARSSTREASWSRASTFSRLVLREVWLNDLRDQVGPLLARLADPSSQALTQAERDACRVAEGRLRDELRAGNLVSRTVADTIDTARARGVDVVLVDNRGSKLPAPARRATLHHLQEQVAKASGGRIVARTAPEGSDTAVTIVSVAPGGAPELTTINARGEVQVRRP